MQRASAAFGLLVFLLWLAVLAVGLAYITVWAATRRRPQWRVLRLFDPPTKPPVKAVPAADSVVSLAEIRSAHSRAGDDSRLPDRSNVIPFALHAAERRRRGDAA